MTPSVPLSHLCGLSQCSTLTFLWLDQTHLTVTPLWLDPKCSTLIPQLLTQKRFSVTPLWLDPVCSTLTLLWLYQRRFIVSQCVPLSHLCCLSKSVSLSHPCGFTKSIPLSVASLSFNERRSTLTHQGISLFTTTHNYQRKADDVHLTVMLTIRCIAEKFHLTKKCIADNMQQTLKRITETVHLIV